MSSSAFRLRVTIVGGSVIRLLYGTRFRFGRVAWVTGLLILGLYLFLRWFVTQLDPVLFLLWAIVFGWTITIGWTATLHLRIRTIEQTLEDHQSTDHVRPN